MGVQFEEDNIARRYADEEMPKMAAWMIKKGIVTNLASANRMQVIMALVFFALAIYFAV